MIILPEGLVEIWSAELTAATEEVAAYYALLSDAERQRCDRLAHPRHRQRAIGARGQLRILLGQYLDLPPRAVPLTLGPQGKPQVPGLEFNLSHSGDRVVYGFGALPLGIDIEQHRPLDYGRLVQRFFAPEEWHQWQALPLGHQPQAFFQAWTLKEAYLKAIGVGLGRSLGTVPVSLWPPAIEASADPPAQSQVLAGEPGWAGALVVLTASSLRFEIRQQTFIGVATGGASFFDQSGVVPG
jgi:4'-phosphopantetheinyl transferase